jgi:hypothetical protein
MNVSASRLNIIVLLITTLFLLRFFVNLFIPGHVISKKNIPGHAIKKVETHESIDDKYSIEKPHNMNDLFAAAERGDTRARVACFIIIVGFIFWAIGTLFFIVEAFKVSTGWGMFVLFGNGIAIFFLMRHWDRAKFPFLIYNLGIGIVIAGACIAVYNY